MNRDEAFELVIGAAAAAGAEYAGWSVEEIVDDVIPESPHRDDVIVRIRRDRESQGMRPR